MLTPQFGRCRLLGAESATKEYCWQAIARNCQRKGPGRILRIERGAKQIGQAQVGPGFNEMFPGIGHTIVEGAKFGGESIKEFFAGKK